MTKARQGQGQGQQMADEESEEGKAEEAKEAWT